MKLWDLPEQTLGKHLVLKTYLDEWLPKLATWNGRTLFIDGFCGPGEYAGGEDGSPIIALKAFRDHPISDKVKEVGFRFCDENLETLEHLAERIEALGPLPDNCTIRLWHGEFESKMNRVLDTMDEKNTELAPALVMLDPFGVKGIPLSLIERIFTQSRCEVLISLMWESINRFITHDNFEAHLRDIFGGEAWLPAMDMNTQERREYLFDLYEKRLKDAGAEQVVRYDLYNGGKHKYSVFFGTRHWKGADAMKRAVWKFAPDGTFEVRAKERQLTLAEFNYRDMETLLRAEFGERWVHVNREMKPFVGSDATPFHTGQLVRKTLQKLRKNDKLEVDPPGRGISKKHVRFK